MATATTQCSNTSTLNKNTELKMYPVSLKTWQAYKILGENKSSKNNLLQLDSFFQLQWNPSKPELLKTGNPSKLNDFVSPEFLSSYLIYPSKPKTPLNQTFSLVRRVFSLEGLHCIHFFYTSINDSIHYFKHSWYQTRSILLNTSITAIL